MSQPNKQFKSSKARMTATEKRLNQQLIRAEARRNGSAENEREYTRVLNAWLLYQERKRAP